MRPAACFSWRFVRATSASRRESSDTKSDAERS
jgi:hypothetical protein